MVSPTNTIADGEALRDSGLHYMSCTAEGYKRVHTPQGFIYLDQHEKEIADQKTIARIQSLVIPPAWTDVWICPKTNGHIQATGIDIRGRKQYLYHEKWNVLSKQNKFSELYIFGKKLHLLEKCIKKDLKKKTLSRQKVCALALAVMSKTYFRVGNPFYEKEYHSYGLTTLHNKHVKSLSPARLFFKFKGKKGVVQESFLTEKSLVRILLKVKEIPGQRLFQYYDKEGNIRHLESGDLNSYLKDCMKTDTSCKNFRTWYGCILALQQLASLPIPDNEIKRKHQLIVAIDNVAKALGNTRTITKSHYIHPLILSDYLDKNLDIWLRRISKNSVPPLTSNVYKNKLLKILKPE